MSWARRLAAPLAGLHVIEESRLRETVDLSWPRIVTGFAIMSKRTVDLAIVGIAVGAEAVAGLTVANAFWTVGKLAFIGLAGGTLTLVSQNYGGGENDRARAVVVASLALATVLSVPVALLFGLGAGPLVALAGGSAAATGFGTTYLALVAPGIVFEALNLVASRSYAGVGDTRTPMAVRAAGAALNIVLSATFVFGFWMGVAGAAIGTTLATGLVAAIFAWGMTGRSYAGRGAIPIPVAAGIRPDADLLGKLGRVSTPLVARRVAQGVAVFPLLAIAATFGSVVLAAVGVARQVRQLLGSFTWGFSIASSTLVGQALGDDDEPLALAYGREITKLSLVVYALAATAVVVLADPIAAVFVDADAVAIAAPFVAVAALASIPLGVDGSVTGALRGAGDTRIPFLATLAGLYLVTLPVAYLGTVSALGATALLVALIAETGVPVLVNVVRFRSGAWLTVSRSYRPGADTDAGD